MIKGDYVFDKKKIVIFPFLNYHRKVTPYLRRATSPVVARFFSESSKTKLKTKRFSAIC